MESLRRRRRISRGFTRRRSKVGVLDLFAAWDVSWKSMLPLVGSMRRSMRRATVLLPEPGSPTRPRVSPRMMSSETPWMTREEPKSLTRSRASSRGSGDMRLLMQGYRRQLLRWWWWESCGVVADDLPAGGCVLDDEQEVAVGVASAG